MTRSGSDVGRLHRNRSKSRCRVVPAPCGASPKPVSPRKRSLAALIALGASLPLVLGAWESHGTGTDASVPGLTAPATDFSKTEEGEDKPGGGATSKASVTNANAFSASSGNMDFKRELDFKIGNAIFRKNWVSAPASTDASDGLGPLFNSRACQNCHLKDGRGHPPFTKGIPDDSHSMLMRLSVPAKTDEEKAKLASHQLNSIPEPTYGGQLQDLSIQGHKAEGQIKIDYKEKPVKLAGGETVHLRVPEIQYRRSRLRAACPRHHDEPARGAADDRAWPARSRARGADPRQRGSRRCKSGRHLGQAQPGLVAREQQGDARPLRLEGGRAKHQPAGGGSGQRRYRPFHHDDPRSPQATAPKARRIASMRRTAIRRNIRTSSLATICSSSSRSIPTTLPSRRGAIPQTPRC